MAKRYTQEEYVAIAKEMYKGFYDYSKTVYLNREQNIIVTCPKHGDFLVRAGNHTNKLLYRACQKCGQEREQAKTQAETFSFSDFVAKSRQAHGDKYDYSQSVYKGSRQPIDIICPKHGVFKMKFACNHYQGNHPSGCTKCRWDTDIHWQKLYAKYRKIHGDKYDYSLVKYESAKTKIKIICPKHGVFKQYSTTHLQGKGCPSCGKFKSTAEEIIASWLKSYDIQYERRTRDVIKPLELDFYIPSRNLAIEYNGMIWHSEKYNPKAQTYHYNKYKICKDKSISLYQIFEWEWRDKHQLILNQLKSKLGLNQKIMARQCSSLELGKKQANVFLQAHHLQGKSNGSTHHYGLEYKQELVAVATFGKARTGSMTSTIDDWEVLRYASKGTVTGGFGKLLSRFLKAVKPKKLISYVDLKYGGDGKLYSENGFSLVSVTQPQYWWVNSTGDVKTRYQTQKSKLVSNPNYSPEKSEVQIMQASKFYRIWGVGNLRFELNT